MADTLTPDAVLAMPAGAELDELVATVAMGWRQREYPEMLTPGRLYWFDAEDNLYGAVCPLMSEDLRYIEPVLDWLRERWGTISIAHNGINWQVMELAGPDRVAYADTLPLALCRVALLETLREGK